MKKFFQKIMSLFTKKSETSNDDNVYNRWRLPAGSVLLLNDGNQVSIMGTEYRTACIDLRRPAPLPQKVAGIVPYTIDFRYQRDSLNRRGIAKRLSDDSWEVVWLNELALG